MCGIAGIWSTDTLSKEKGEVIDKMVDAIKRRGPDFQDVKHFELGALGHARLSILDVSEAAHQPMTDPSGRYTLVFNGEIYNYKALGQELSNQEGVQFHSSGDTEVLLQGLIQEGEAFIEKLNGFFAFAFLDKQANTLLLARDRYGIKPLYYHHSKDLLLFGSSLSAVAHGLDKKELNQESLAQYLQYSYIPAPNTIFQQVFKLEPGHFLKTENGSLSAKQYYQLPKTELSSTNPVDGFKNLLTQSVRDRLVSDVPLGTFLSGGYDSSVITLLASRDLPKIPAFSIGFPDHPYYDESPQAAAIAKHLNLEHHIIEVGEKHIDENLHNVLDAIDEPFADSSAVLMNILSEYTRKQVKVALSGDGADEIMGGYNKHRALLRSNQANLTNSLIKAASPALALVPEARNSKLLNQMRKAKRYAKGLNLHYNERYDAWASFTNRNLVNQLLTNPPKNGVLNHEVDEQDFNSILRADMRLVLPNDMLHKVDLMSMYHGLEVRVPFLDHRIVDFLFKLPANQKVNEQGGKLLLKEAFKNDFPTDFFSRKKKGFEAPLGHWLKGPLEPHRKKYLNQEYIEKQGIFNFETIQRIESKSLSSNPGDTPHTMWALLVFQDWYTKHF